MGMEITAIAIAAISALAALLCALYARLAAGEARASRTETTHNNRIMQEFAATQNRITAAAAFLGVILDRRADHKITFEKTEKHGKSVRKFGDLRDQLATWLRDQIDIEL